MNFKKIMLKIGSYLLFAFSLFFLFMPSAIAYILGIELFKTTEILLETSALSYSLLFIVLSYLCHRFSKIKEISFSALLFLFPCQFFIISAVVNLLIPNGHLVAFLITPIWVLISLKIYQFYKKKGN